MQLSKQKSSVRELENLLQLTENKNNRLSVLEADVRQKEETIIKLQGETVEFQKLLSDTQALYEMEKRKVYEHKESSSSKIIELENLTEKQRTRILTLEARLDSAHNEVQRKNDDPQPPPRKKNKNNTDVGSFLVCNASAAADLPPKKTVSKLTPSPNSSRRSVTTSSNNLDEHSGAVVTFASDHSAASLLQLQNHRSKSKKHIFKLEQD